MYFCKEMCFVDTCKTLDSLPNDNIEYDSDSVNGRYSFGTKVTASCNSGYERKGWRVRECLTSAEWEGEKARCEPGNEILCSKNYFILFNQMCCKHMGFSKIHTISSIGIGGFLAWKNNSNKMLHPVRIQPETTTIQVWWSPFWAGQVCVSLSDL